MGKHKNNKVQTTDPEWFVLNVVDFTKNRKS